MRVLADLGRRIVKRAARGETVDIDKSAMLLQISTDQLFAVRLIESNPSLVGHVGDPG